MAFMYSQSYPEGSKYRIMCSNILVWLRYIILSSWRHGSFVPLAHPIIWEKFLHILIFKRILYSFSPYTIKFMMQEMWILFIWYHHCFTSFVYYRRTETPPARTPTYNAAKVTWRKRCSIFERVFVQYEIV